MILHIRKNEYLSKVSHEIIEQINRHKKIALFSSMGTGKSTFFKKELSVYAKEKGLTLVMVNPSISQIEQIGEENPHIATICQGKNYYNEEVAVSTPESLHKVMSVLLENNRKFILVFDEVHEKVVSVNFRKKFSIVEKYEKYAEKVIYMTATPEPLLNENFDEVISVIKEDDSILPCNVLRAERLNTSTKIKHIEKCLNNNEYVIFINDNKAENLKIEQYLNDRYGKESIYTLEEEVQESLFDDREVKTSKSKNFDLISSENRNSLAYKSIIKGEYPQGLKVLITTSAIKAGLDIFNPADTRLIITSTEENFLLANNIQQMGRLRNQENVKCIDLLIPKIDVPRQYENGFSSFESVAERLTEQAESHYNIYVKNALYIPSNDSLEISCSVYDNESDNYIIDYNKLTYKAYSHYCRTLLIYPNRLKIELERQQAIRLRVTIQDIDHEENGTVEEDVKNAKKERKELHEQSKKDLLQLNDTLQESIIMIQYNEITLLSDDVRHIAEHYHLYMSDSERAFINQVRRELCDGDKLQAHLKVLKEPKADIRREFEQLEVIKINHEYDLVKDNQAVIDATISRHKKKLISKVFFIRKELADLEPRTVNGKTVRGRLSNKRIDNLAQKMLDEGYYKGKKINLEKARAMLRQDLSLLYNVRNNQIYRIKR